MYDAVADEYCYPGTTVLKNKLDIRDGEELDAFEAEVSDTRADEEIPAGDVHRHRNILIESINTLPIFPMGSTRTGRSRRDRKLATGRRHRRRSSATRATKCTPRGRRGGVA
ncbi:filamentation induced by cAMP protein Fic [Bradyrhizobium oligotrophicum S58]|uniref:Filamentation induced by cAMP protein Fic n=1 Tax=Bradyrhizobium oligotrophicum S58 TaxID=1245469 RepID=M4ZFJ2_9BRAD|nr:filamentation induced by cAMP protein Fic [Bradyrhizobium oligotrophicum]BAM92291.1 filamentation induced by cAMP protein Fic [Bradyrhizobium oligotrophicum S58]